MFQKFQNHLRIYSLFANSIYFLLSYLCNLLKHHSIAYFYFSYNQILIFYDRHSHFIYPYKLTKLFERYVSIFQTKTNFKQCCTVLLLIDRPFAIQLHFAQALSFFVMYSDVLLLHLLSLVL